MDTGLPVKLTSAKHTILSNAATTKQETEIILDPVTPIFLPKIPVEIELNKGKANTVKYILS